MTGRKKLTLAATILGLIGITYGIGMNVNLNRQHQVGEVIDSFHGVKVYYNGAVNHTTGRNTSADGYNLGIRYQCVEFVKRYYYERFGHKMPDSYGHAKHFFNVAIKDGTLNPARGLIQFVNGGKSRPQVDDLVVFAPWTLNRYGHVAIISAVDDTIIEVVQQNPGPFGSTREQYPLHQRTDGVWVVEHARLLGWLRLPE
jgi:hypothetical protein